MSAAIAALILLFLSVGYWNATQDPVIVRHRIALDGLPPGTEIRVLHMSDIHYGYPDMRTRRMLRIVAQANRLKPDLVVLTGDYLGGKYLDWPRSWLEEALPPLAGLRAPLGIYAVQGNHDGEYWLKRIMQQQIEPRLLLNEHVDVGPLVVAGVRSAVRGANVNRTLAGIPEGKPILLVRHEADFMQFSRKKPPNPVLVLGGHTHGGQVVLPFIGSVGNKFYSQTLCRRGLCDIGGWRVFVSSGIGTSVLPIRFGVPPEMVLLTLYSP